MGEYDLIIYLFSVSVDPTLLIPIANSMNIIIKLIINVYIIYQFTK